MSVSLSEPVSVFPYVNVVLCLLVCLSVPFQNTISDSNCTRTSLIVSATVSVTQSLTAIVYCNCICNRVYVCGYVCVCLYLWVWLWSWPGLCDYKAVPEG